MKYLWLAALVVGLYVGWELKVRDFANADMFGLHKPPSLNDGSLIIVNGTGHAIKVTPLCPDGSDQLQTAFVLQPHAGLSKPEWNYYGCKAENVR